MAEPKKYKIVAQYEYEGVIEGTDERNAEHNFLTDLNNFYADTISFEIEEVCFTCEGELDLDGSCFECRDDEEEAE
jgi:hypothetical protein